MITGGIYTNGNSLTRANQSCSVASLTRFGMSINIDVIPIKFDYLSDYKFCANERNSAAKSQLCNLMEITIAKVIDGRS